MSDEVKPAGLLGWRVWQISHAGDLLSVFKSEPWPRDKPMLARCRAAGSFAYRYVSRGERPITHAAPNYDCLCGIYSWLSPHFLGKEAWAIQRLPGGAFDWRKEKTETLVLGSVWIWGSVVPHQFGNRAEYARVKNLVIDHPALTGDLPVEDVAKTYKVPVVSWKEVERWEELENR